MLNHLNLNVIPFVIGSLTVDSFTWSADIFPFTRADGPLFHWICAPPAPSSTMGMHIWMLSGTLYIGLSYPQDGVALPARNVNYPLVANQWNKVAVAYESSSRLFQLYVNGHIEDDDALSTSAPHSTYGQVLLGSWFHFSYWSDPRAFNGSMACVKLWNFYRDLTTYRADTLACQYLYL